MSIPVPPAPPSSTLAELLSRWQAWSVRNTLTYQVSTARAAGEAEQVAILTRAMRAAAGIKPLDALAANHQLAHLLIAQQPQAIQAARKAGATWEQIATAIGTTAEQACADWLAHSGPPSRTTGIPTTSAADDRIGYPEIAPVGPQRIAQAACRDPPGCGDTNTPVADLVRRQ